MTARIVTTKFTIGCFPAPEWLRRSRKSCVEAEGVQQPIRRQGIEIAAVGFHSRLAGTLAKAHLSQREGTGLPFDFLAVDRFAIPLNGIENGVLRRCCWR